MNLGPGQCSSFKPAGFGEEAPGWWRTCLPDVAPRDSALGWGRDSLRRPHMIRFQLRFTLLNAIVNVCQETTSAAGKTVTRLTESPPDNDLHLLNRAEPPLPGIAEMAASEVIPRPVPLYPNLKPVLSHGFDMLAEFPQKISAGVRDTHVSSPRG